MPLKLALRDTFEIFQLLKEDKTKLISDIILEKLRKEKKERLLIARTTKRASPSRERLSKPERTASLEASKAAEASPWRTSGDNNSLVAAMMILPEESLIIAVANAEVPLIATSKLALIITKGGGSQRGEVKPYHSKLKCAYP